MNMNKELENKRPEEPVTGEENAVSEEAAPADAGQEEEKAAERMSWEEILEDPEYRSRYDAAVQGIVTPYAVSRVIILQATPRSAAPALCSTEHQPREISV